MMKMLKLENNKNIMKYKLPRPSTYKQRDQIKCLASLGIYYEGNLKNYQQCKQFINKYLWLLE